MSEIEPVRVGENVLYLFLLVLIGIFAGISEAEWDLTGVGFGYVDPYVFLWFLILGCYFFTRYIVFKVRAISLRYASNLSKGPLLSWEPTEEIGETVKNIDTKSRLIADPGLIHRTGVSKPRIKTVTGPKFQVFPNKQWVPIGGTKVITSFMEKVRKGAHNEVPPNICRKLERTQGYIWNKTRLEIGELPNPKFAVRGNLKGRDGNVRETWLIREKVGDSILRENEAALCRRYYRMRDEADRVDKVTGVRGRRPKPEPEPEGRL